jgi:FAD/FMN-containing dehydrogenase
MRDGLQHAIRGPVYTRGQRGFAPAAQVFNPRFDHLLPDAVAQPVNATDVRDAIRFCTEHRVQVRARSGGHSYGGYSTASCGVVLDLRRLDRITVDQGSGTATIEAGARLIDVYGTLAARGLTLPGGSCPSVGIAGATLGGGFGLAARHFGLTIDSLVAVEIVTADGQLRSIDAASDPDLLWALKGGGGGNFGIVTAFSFTTHRMPRSSTFFEVTWPWPAAGEAIDVWQNWAPRATDAVTSILHVESSGPRIFATGQYIGQSDQVAAVVKPLLGATGASLAVNTELPYLEIQLLLAGCEGRTVAACHTAGAALGGVMPRATFNAKSDYVTRPLPAAGRAAMIAAVEHPGAGDLLCDAYGGAIAQVGPDSTAFVHRDPLFCIQYYGAGAGAEWIEQAWTRLRPFVSGMAYQNYIDPALNGWQQAYYGKNLVRLEATRKRVDPHHFFNFPQAIGR